MPGVLDSGVEKVIRVVDLGEPEPNPWADASAEERIAAVELLRRAAWELHGKPDYGLERVLRVADLGEG